MIEHTPSTPPRSSELPRHRRRTFDWAFVLVCLISLVSFAIVALRDGMSEVRNILSEDAILLVEILPKVLAGTAIGALVRLLVSADTIRRFVGTDSGIKGLLIATIAGAIFPGGPFTIFPLAAAFMLAGADRGAAVTFITSWLLLGINRMIIWEMPFLGADFIILRGLISLPIPILIGIMARGTARLSLFQGQNRP
jgi:uncharacterized membrane protein YraQ (UPF0718 family)